MFYSFHQNNSGGSHVINEDRGISVNVIVEADSAPDANDRAERIGLYFAGCSDGRDCSCCGDRWSEQWSDDGDEVPSHYGTPLIDYHDEWHSGASERVDTFVHLKDGRKFGFHLIEGYYVYRGDPADLVEALPATSTKEIEA